MGIAGAHVVRALAGGAVLPSPLLGFLGATYATFWSVLGARASCRLAKRVYVATSVAILSPMLWEMCLRFHAMSPSVAALVLSSYPVIACVSVRPAFSWLAFSILYAGSALTALALCIATRNMMPFLAIMLAMIAFGEFCWIRSDAMPGVAVVWLAADLTLLSILVVYRLPAAARPNYPALSPAIVLAGSILLFLLQTAVIANQFCIRRKTIAMLDAIQWMAVFALLVIGVFWIAPSSHALAIGSLCLVLYGGCYWAPLRTVSAATRPRDLRVFATWVFLLMIAGQLLLLPAIAPVTLGITGILAIFAAGRMQSMGLPVHALTFLVVGAFACGLPAHFWSAMVTDAAAHPAWSVMADVNGAHCWVHRLR